MRAVGAESAVPSGKESRARNDVAVREPSSDNSRYTLGAGTGSDGQGHRISRNTNATTATTSRSRSASSIGANSSLPLPRTRPRPGGALHGLRHALLSGHRSSPARRAARSTTRSRTGTTSSISGDWDEAARNLHSTNNFPEVHRPRLPGAVRGVLHAQHRRQPGHHQDDRMRDRRPRHRARLAQARTAGGEDRQEGRRRRLGSGRPGLRAAARARRPRRARLREIRQGRRAAPLRHSRLQDGEASHRPPRRADGGRGRRLPLRRPCRRQHAGRQARSPTTTRSCWPAAPRSARDLPIPGRELNGIHFAMDFLPQQNRRVSGEPRGDGEPILASGKHVVVIGGGDTGSDCIGTSIRQGALSVTNFEIMPQPPEHENKVLTWPNWPLKLRTSSSHEEGAERDFAVLTHEILRRERPGQDAALRARRRQDSSRSRAPSSSSRPTSCCWRWASCIRCTRA